MGNSSITIDPFDRRGSLRIIIDDYYTVEFLTTDRECVYVFKIRDASTQGMGILVEENSPLLKKIKKGDILTMKYYPTQAKSPIKPARVKIAHISKFPQFEGFLMVGLTVIEDQSGNSLCKGMGEKI